MSGLGITEATGLHHEVLHQDFFNFLYTEKRERTFSSLSWEFPASSSIKAIRANTSEN